MLFYGRSLPTAYAYEVKFSVRGFLTVDCDVVTVVLQDDGGYSVIVLFSKRKSPPSFPILLYNQPRLLRVLGYVCCRGDMKCVY
jgi:hypothetical protein